MTASDRAFPLRNLLRTKSEHMPFRDRVSNGESGWTHGLMHCNLMLLIMPDRKHSNSQFRHPRPLRAVDKASNSFPIAFRVFKRERHMLGIFPYLPTNSQHHSDLSCMGSHIFCCHEAVPFEVEIQSRNRSESVQIVELSPQFFHGADHAPRLQ